MGLNFMSFFLCRALWCSSVVSLSKTLYPHCLVLVSTQEDLRVIQSTLVISNSLISNNCLSRSENLVPVLTQRSTNRQQNIVEKSFSISLT